MHKGGDYRKYLADFLSCPRFIGNLSNLSSLMPIPMVLPYKPLIIINITDKHTAGTAFTSKKRYTPHTGDIKKCYVGILIRQNDVGNKNTLMDFIGKRLQGYLSMAWFITEGTVRDFLH